MALIRIGRRERVVSISLAVAALAVVGYAGPARADGAADPLGLRGRDIVVTTSREGSVVTIRWQPVDTARRPGVRVVQVWPRPENAGPRHVERAGRSPRPEVPARAAGRAAASPGAPRLAVNRTIQPLEDPPSRRIHDDPRESGTIEVDTLPPIGRSREPLGRFFDQFLPYAQNLWPGQLEEAYGVWRHEERRIEALREHRGRVARLRRGFDTFMANGLDAFRAGKWSVAANYFVAAARTDHGDAVSRIHAGQALVAARRYGEALTHFRRAAELRPTMLRMPLDLSADYTDRGDFDEHLDALASHADRDPTDGKARLLVALVRRFGPDPDSARADLIRARKLMRGDPLLDELAKVTHSAPSL